MRIIMAVVVFHTFRFVLLLLRAPFFFPYLLSVFYGGLVNHHFQTMLLLLPYP